MEAFAAVVETGGFQSAARQLGVSRALVSKRVAGLEQAMGVQFLRRTTRKLSVTGPGEEFYERCRRILAEFHEATGELALLQREPRGALKVNAPMSFGQLHLAGALLAFMCEHPKIIVQLTLTDRFVDVVEEGYDVVVRIGALRGSSLIARRLCPIRRVLCASPGYLAEAGSPTTPAALRDHRLLQYGQLATGQRWQLTGPDGEVGGRGASDLLRQQRRRAEGGRTGRPRHRPVADLPVRRRVALGWARPGPPATRSQGHRTARALAGESPDAVAAAAVRGLPGRTIRG